MNNRQNTEQAATILLTCESDEERMILQNSKLRLCTMYMEPERREDKRKLWIDMIREECSELHNDILRGHMQDAGHEDRGEQP